MKTQQLLKKLRHHLDYSWKVLETNNGLQPKRIRSKSQLVKISVTHNVNSLPSLRKRGCKKAKTKDYTEKKQLPSMQNLERRVKLLRARYVRRPEANAIIQWQLVS